MNLIFASFYFLLPAYFSNIAASLAGKLKFLPQPLDFSRKLGNNFILGQGKTWGGTILGILTGIFIVALQELLFSFDYFKNISVINYQEVNWLFLGILAGVGSVGGDIVASFIKRRINLKSGAMAPFLDQWDYIIGYLLLISIMAELTPRLIITSLILTIILHPLANILSYHLKIKKVWW